MNTARRLLSKLRQGDYAHAGDREAISLLIQKALKLSPNSKKGPCLDVGCGFGGSAHDLQESGFQNLFGIDMDAAAISYAKAHYPKVEFVEGAVSDIPRVFKQKFFSFIYLLNVFYAIPDQLQLLKDLSQVAKPGALLAIFDYTAKRPGFQGKDLADKPMQPMVIQDLPKQLVESGWEALEILDLSEQYVIWYRDFLEKLSSSSAILTEFSARDVEKVRGGFTQLLQALRNGSLGGALIYALKTNL